MNIYTWSEIQLGCYFIKSINVCMLSCGGNAVKSFSLEYAVLPSCIPLPLFPLAPSIGLNNWCFLNTNPIQLKFSHYPRPRPPPPFLSIPPGTPPIPSALSLPLISSRGPRKQFLPDSCKTADLYTVSYIPRIKMHTYDGIHRPCFVFQALTACGEVEKAFIFEK